jgi:hypothetical protein
MSRNDEIVGGEDGYFPTHSRKFPRTHATRVEIILKREKLRQQREMWDLERELEDDILEFREIQEDWMDGQEILKEMLERMMESGLCKKLSVWRNTHTHTDR